MEGINKKYFFKILSSYINEILLENNNEVNWNSIFRIANNHSLSGIVYITLQKQSNILSISKDILEKEKINYFMQLQNSVNQEYEMKKLVKELSLKGIYHVLMKGYVIKNLYPDPDLRTMGDVDFLVKDKDINKVHEILLSLGYIHMKTVRAVRNYSKVGMNLEVHTSIFYDKISEDVDYEEYFNKAWDNVILKEGNFTYEFTLEYHFIFLIAHLAKHFYNEGCGVRMFLDIVIYLKQYKDKIDWDYFWSEIDKIKLKKFTKSVFTLCSFWFGVEFKEEVCLEESFLENITEYIINSGTFGKSVENDMLNRYRREMENPKKNTDVSMIFPSFDGLSNEFSYVKKYKFLYPIAWFNRAFRLVTTRRKTTIYKIINKSKFKENAKNIYYMHRKMGL